MLPNAKPLRRLAILSLVLVDALLAGGSALANPTGSGNGGGGFIEVLTPDTLHLFSGGWLSGANLFSPFYLPF